SGRTTSALLHAAPPSSPRGRRRAPWSTGKPVIAPSARATAASWSGRCSGAGFAGATISGGRHRKGGGAPLRVRNAQKGPDARRRPRAGREAYSLYVERPAEGANAADGPFSAFRLRADLAGDPVVLRDLPQHL